MTKLLTTPRVGVLALLMACTIPHFANAVPFVKSNAFAKVLVDDQSGKFQIFEVAPLSTPLTYPGKFSSHTNFLMNVSGTQTVFTNEIDGSYAIAGATVHRADSIYYEGDSIIAQYNLYGFRIRQYTYPFLTYSSGQIAIEYRTTRVDTNSTNKLLGILLELDIFAADPQNICVGGGNDRSLILDAHGYEAKPNPPSCWTGQTAKYSGSNTVPMWFHAARQFPNYSCNGCAIGTGKLYDTSRVNSPIKNDPTKPPILVPPDEFYVGDWGQNGPLIGLKNVAWNVTAPNFASPGTYSDCALIYKWNVGSIPYRCCTTYGPNDDANDNMLCPGQGVFVDIRFSKRIDHLTNGQYLPPVQTLRVWGANTDPLGVVARNMQCTIDTTGTCLLLTTTPPQSLTKNMKAVGSNSNDIAQSGSGYCEFTFRVDSSRCCIPGQTTLHDDPVKLKVTTGNYPIFYFPCSPTTQVECYSTPPDTLAPLATLVTPPVFAKYAWDVSDNRQWDLGIDSIIVVLAQNFKPTIPAFTRCSMNALQIEADVVDTLKAGCVDIDVVDCAHNRTRIHQCYAPSADRNPPVVTLFDTSKPSSGSSAHCDSNFQCGVVHVSEHNPYDLGIKSVSKVQAINCTYTVRPFTAGALDAYVDVCTTDRKYNATLQILATDMNDQATPFTWSYCTLQDTTRPVITPLQVSGDTYSFVVTEAQQWDRGLLDVISSAIVNCTVTGPTINATQDSAFISFSVRDTSQDASFCFTARDQYFQNLTDVARFGGDSLHHLTNLCGSFVSGVDTLAPTVRIIPNPATGGYDATVIAADRHYLANGTLYQRDKHLKTVTPTNAINVDLTQQPPVNICQDDSITFTIRALDTLSLTDTVACVSFTATDCEGLTSNTANWCYPIHPDTLAPHVTYSDGPTRDQVIFHVTDNQPYDRGLFEIVIDSTVNVDPLISTNLGGARTRDFTLHIIDTTLPAHARICVTDAFTNAHPALMSTQQTCFDFDTHVIPIWPDAVNVGQGGGNLLVGINIQQPAVNTHLRQVQFDVVHRRENGLRLVTVQSPATNQVTPQWNDDVPPQDPVWRRARVTFKSNAEIDPTISKLGTLVFATSQPEGVAFDSIIIDPRGVAYNDYTTDPVTLLNVTAPRLAPFAAVPNNGQMAISGRCRQVLLLTGSASFSLDQSVPNPAASEAEITYSLDRFGPVRLVLCNAVGVPVQTLVDGQGQPGTYRVAFDVSGMRSGVYYYRLECSGAVQSRAMSIMR